ncbi:PD40 domain-containing protein [Streptomyces seoulensis]|nr:PD40 domain-containing protein [Streptomyces seoulensis]
MAARAVREAGGDTGGSRPVTRRLMLGGGVLAAAVLLGAGMIVPAAAEPGPATVPGFTQRVSHGPGGAQPDAPSRGGGVSDDGRYVLFSSAASGLVPGDTNGVEDAFVRDTWTGRVQRVCVGDHGKQLTTPCPGASLSGDGRYVAFGSDEPGLVDDDTDDRSDVFVFDRVTGRTVRATPGAEGGGFDPAISRDGRYIAFSSVRKVDLPGGERGRQNVYVLDRSTGVTRLASITRDGAVPDQPSRSATISADGQRVAFISRTFGLADDPGDPDDPGDATEDPGEGAGASILKPTLYPMYVYDLRTGRVQRGSEGPDRLLGSPSGRITPDGRHVAFIGWEVDTRPGAPSGGLLPHRYVAYVHDLETGKTVQMSRTTTGEDGNGDDTEILTSGDGHWAYFASTSDGLVPGDTDAKRDVFRRDLRTGHTETLVDLGPNPSEEADTVTGADALGTSVVVTGPDGILGHPGDTNGYSDVFVRRVLPW